MAQIEFEAGSYQLDQINLYPAPNPALTEVLKSETLKAVVSEYTAKVALNYVQRLANRPHRNDQHDGKLEGDVQLTVDIGGYRHDRQVGVVRVVSDYALADEYGRHAYNPYPGHHDLHDALFNVLEQRL